MHFTQLTSIFLFFLTFGLVAGRPTPNAVEKRQADSVTDILSTLQASVGSVLPQIATLVNSGTANDETAAPLLGELTTALDTATGSLAGLDSSDADPTSVALLLVPIISQITGGVAPLQPSVSAKSFGGPDAALAKLLKGVEGLLAGVLKLVAILLFDVAALLKKLAFALTLAALGLK